MFLMSLILVVVPHRNASINQNNLTFVITQFTYFKVTLLRKS
jgi:hypothetical protein